MDPLVLELALEKLAALDPEAARIVTMRFFGARSGGRNLTRAIVLVR